ncbi:MAG: signal peptidase I [Nanoarchaeota archaeon]|nr:signal peptidase I [Nanoarchaeota archaeon]
MITLKKIWRFIWYDDSLLSWIVNIILAFIIVKFLIYPGLGLVLGGTTHPVVAVVSGSMQHNGLDFDDWWDRNDAWYIENNISKNDFDGFVMGDGFNRGDIIVLKKSETINVGDIIVFRGSSNNPIIHRVVKRWNENGETYYQTKGDNNSGSFSALGETKINEGKIVGKAMFKIPYLGYVKIIFSEVFGGILK